MKIGILTHHYVKNFGAYMQAKALMSVIVELYPTAQVEFIDFRVKKHEMANVIHFFGYKPKRGDTLQGFIQKVKLFFTHQKAEKTLPCSKRVKTAEEINSLKYDLIIVGSDEVWNFNDIAYSPIKFGKGITCTHITYSASAGGSTAEDKSIQAEIKKGIDSFSKVAVRDEKTEELVRKLSGHKPIRTLDPVYLYDYELKIGDRIKKIALSKPYILIYDCKLDKKHIEALKDYAKENDYHILGAGEYRNWYTTTATTNITPYEWAYLFKNAVVVVTGTFHGTSFAIKYNRPFVSYLTEQNRINKVGSLLSEFGLSDRIVGANDEIIKVLTKPIDYEEVNKTIQEMTAASISYICGCIDEVNRE